MKKNKIISFKWMPAAWGLSGIAYKEAEAYYYYDGEELDRELSKIKCEQDMDKNAYQIRETLIDFKYAKIDEFEKEKRILTINDELTPQKELDLLHKHSKIDAYEYERQLAELDKDADDRELALLVVDYKHGKIEKNAFEKKEANIKKEPWIGIIDHGFDLTKGINGVYFEFDWNPYWIQYLELHGYKGETEDDIVESWFSDVCNTVAKESNITNGENFTEI